MTTRVSIPGISLVWLRACLALAACALAASAAAESPVRTIEVTREGDAYIVNAQMFAPVPQAVVWDVLTDFPNMAKWVPNVVESRIATPGDKQMTIEQKGTAKFGALSFSYTSLREIVLNPQLTILSTQVKGSMKKQQSLMTLSADAGGTKMQYRLELIPTWPASSVLSPEFLKHEIDEQFTAIVGEMVKRKK